MKHTIFRSILCAAILFLCGFSAYVSAQSSSTEGKEFWVALTKAKTTGSGGYTPYITISAKKACHIEIKNPNTTWAGVSKDINPGTTEIGTNEIPLAQWANTSFNTSDFQTPQALGLQITSTEYVSVYVASRMEFSFDATNVLPITALTGEYMIQDYPACDHEDKADQNSATFAIVATEDNTNISIVPTVETRNGNAAGSTIKATLQKGQVYHVISVDKKGSSFTGTTINADKKIAVFAGDVNTDVPGEASARDLLYEQAMPTAFWGTEFIVTRTMERDADRVRFTALNDNTDITINGIKYATINSGQTFEVELGEGNIDQSALNKMFTGYDALISGADAHYVKTSCPVAAYLYIVSQKYKNKESTYDNGDPSMVWISPLEQKIKEITFSNFATDKTTDHYVNIITETNNVESVQLLDPDGKNIISPSDFQTVPGNTHYSYARKLLDNSLTSKPVSKRFTLKGKKGLIAHVYGNGEKESYAYSVGSAAVQRSIEIDGMQLSDGDSAVICLGEPIEFATNFTTYTVDQITWDMGDGVTRTYTSDESSYYLYDSPGWYDIIVTYSLTNSCTGEIVANESMKVMLYANIPDTIRRNHFLCEGESLNGITYNHAGQYIDTVTFDCDYVEIQHIIVGSPTDTTINLRAFDSVFVQGDANNPDQYVYESTELQRKYTNYTGCDSTVRLIIEVVHCVEMQVSAPSELCGGDELAINYTLLKGEMPMKGSFTAGSKTYNIRISQETDNTGIIYVYDIAPGRYPNAVLQLSDEICNRTYEVDIPLVVNFSSDIVKQKWNNVIAVKNEKYNGGYEFSAYQWYKNGEEIEGATGSYYYVGSDAELDFTASYYVRLTTTSGITLNSCPFYPVDKYADEDEANVSVSPTVVSPNETINIFSDLAGKVVIYSTSGIYETQRDVNNSTTSMRAPSRTGVYVVQVTLENGKTRSFHILVK